jgi:signal peptidase II
MKINTDCYKLSILVLILVILLDQITKSFVLKEFLYSEHNTIFVTSFFNLVLTFNYGVSFGIFPAHDSLIRYWFIIIFTITLISVLSFWWFKEENKFEKISYSMIVGGGIGNIIDRVTLGAVVDFLDFHINDLHWAAFNVADSFIVIGVFGLIFKQLFFSQNKKTI